MVYCLKKRFAQKHSCVCVSLHRVSPVWGKEAERMAGPLLTKCLSAPMFGENHSQTKMHTNQVME